jgi:hypothetical protein
MVNGMGFEATEIPPTFTQRMFTLKVWFEFTSELTESVAVILTLYVRTTVL